jgi:hypothetical protein
MYWQMSSSHAALCRADRWCILAALELQLLWEKCDKVTVCLLTNSVIWVTIVLCQVTSVPHHYVLVLEDILRGDSYSIRHERVRRATHSHPVIIGKCFHGGKTVGAWMLLLICMWCLLRIRGKLLRPSPTSSCIGALTPIRLLNFP